MIDPMTIYRPGQAAEHFLPFVPRVPQWFIDLGPGNAAEHTDARKFWPAVRLLGLEPTPIGYECARKHWPADGTLLQIAAWDKDETVTLHKTSDLLHGTAYSDYAHILADDLTGQSGDMSQVQGRSLDSLDAEYGPFAEAVLWMDIDGSELRALKGATGLLTRGAIIAINIETRPDFAAEMSALLKGYGFRSVRKYLKCATYWDEVWVR